MSEPDRIQSNQRGIALVTSLLLLLVVTIMAMAMFRSYGLQEKIAGNLREKQRAFHSAATAEQYAEWWLSQSNNATSASVVCANLLNANTGQGQICSNGLAATLGAVSVASAPLPWTTSGANGGPIGVSYTPQAMDVTTAAAMGTYYNAPTFYISDLGPSANGTPGEVFQIDAAGFGATPSAVAIIESTYLVGPEVVCLSCQ